MEEAGERVEKALEAAWDVVRIPRQPQSPKLQSKLVFDRVNNVRSSHAACMVVPRSATPHGATLCSESCFPVENMAPCVTTCCACAQAVWIVLPDTSEVRAVCWTCCIGPAAGQQNPEWPVRGKNLRI